MTSYFCIPVPYNGRRPERSYSTLKVRRGGSEEIPLVLGKEQWLRFKRNPNKMVDVARGIREQTHKPYHRKLIIAN